MLFHEREVLTLTLVEPFEGELNVVQDGTVAIVSVVKLSSLHPVASPTEL